MQSYRNRTYTVGCKKFAPSASGTQALVLLARLTNPKTRISNIFQLHIQNCSILYTLHTIYWPLWHVARRYALKCDLGICELKSYGLSCAKIYRIHPEISLNTIKTTIRREASRLNNVSKPRSGRPHKLNEEERDHIYGLTTDNPHIKMRDLLAEVDHKVKKRSIQYLLCEIGHHKWLQLRRPEIRPHHAHQRLR
jgi:transposase